MNVIERLIAGVASVASGLGSSYLIKWWFENYFFVPIGQQTPYLQTLAEYSMGAAVILCIICVVLGIYAIFGDN